MAAREQAGAIAAAQAAAQRDGTYTEETTVRHKSESTLNLFRGAGLTCEYCRYVTRCEAHHVLARGVGSGSRIDLPINLLSLCAGPGGCHGLAHTGKVGRKKLIAVVAFRECLPPEVVEDQLHRLLRAPKGSVPCRLCQGSGWVRVRLLNHRDVTQAHRCLCEGGIIAPDGSYWREQPRRLAGT